MGYVCSLEGKHFISPCNKVSYFLGKERGIGNCVGDFPGNFCFEIPSRLDSPSSVLRSPVPDRLVDKDWLIRKTMWFLVAGKVMMAGWFSSSFIAIRENAEASIQDFYKNMYKQCKYTFKAFKSIIVAVFMYS